jgi:ketosteroid isomerase-like protein
MFEDWLAIQNLIGRYAELLNTGQFDEVGELFRHGRVVVEGNPDPVAGAREVAEMYRESTRVPPTGPDSLLYTTNLQVELDGDSARARSYFVALHDKGDGVVVPVVGGRYRDAFRKHADGWHFEERRITVDLVGALGDHINRPLEDYLTQR